MKGIKILRLVLLMGLLYFLLINSICEDDDPGDPTAGLYHTFAEVETELTALADTFSTVASVSSIGTSVQGRDIWALKISDNVSTNARIESVVLT